MDYEVEQLEAAIGRAVKDVRDEYGITLDQLAKTVREFGVPWSTARVIEFEKGKMRVTLPMLLAVAQSLSSITERAVSLQSLLADGSSWVRITPQWVTPRDQVAEALAGGEVRLPLIAAPADDLPAGWTEAHAPDELVATLAEERAARRLGVRPRQVAMWSHMLWRSHLDDEVLRRSGADATPQARGHITRELVRILAERLEVSDGHS